MKSLWSLLQLTLYCGIAAAQSAEVPSKIIHQTQPLTSARSYVAPDTSNNFVPPMVNIFTVAGGDVSDLPCYNCVTGVASPNLGVVAPVYFIPEPFQINVFLVDNSYNGACTYTIAALKSNRVVKTVTETFDEMAGTTILLGTVLSIHHHVPAGQGSIVTTAVCGKSTTTSSSRIYF
jgi:hypothetical protein